MRSLLAALILAPPAAAQDAAPEAPPARVVIELGDVEVKVRSLTVTATLDPERAAALARAVSAASTARIGAETAGE